MNRGIFADRAGRALLALLVIGLTLVLARFCHLIAWPWWLVLLPWGLWLAAGLGVIAAVLVMAAVDEWQAARARRAERERKTFHYDL